MTLQQWQLIKFGEPHFIKDKMISFTGRQIILPTGLTKWLIVRNIKFDVFKKLKRSINILQKGKQKYKNSKRDYDLDKLAFTNENL